MSDANFENKVEQTESKNAPWMLILNEIMC